MNKYKDYSGENKNNNSVSPLLISAAEIPSTMVYQQPLTSQRNIDTPQTLIDILQNLGYRSIFDIAKISRQRFIKRHDESLRGNSAVIFDRSVSLANQILQTYRKNRLSEHGEPLAVRAFTSDGQSDGQEQGKLPDYSSLFPEPWDDFCRPGAIEALDSPASYLLDLYKFVTAVELDGSNQALKLATRRGDIPDLSLDNDALYKEVTALSIVNDVLSGSAQEYIGQSGHADKTVNQILASTHFPFTLPYSLPTQQINKGLGVQDLELGSVIQHVDLPTFWNTSADKYQQILLAYTQLSSEQISLLSKNDVFAQHLLTKENLTNGYLSGSTTEILFEKDLSRHGYIVKPEAGINGPAALTENSEKPFDIIEVVCRNKANETITVKLRGENIITYHRIKARMVPFDNSPPFSRQLKLSYHAEDNPAIDTLDNGPFFANMTIYAAEQVNSAGDNSEAESVPFLTLTYRLAIANAGTAQAELEPEAGAFFINNYGLSADDSGQLKKLAVFGDQTGTKAADIEDLLSAGEYLPIASPNVVFNNPIFTNGQSEQRFPAPYHFGGIYINACQQPALTIIRTGTDHGREIQGVSNFRLERLNRFVRLQRWLAVPFYQLDLLLASAMQAEPKNTQFEITDNVLTCLGLFRHLNLQYKVTPEMFSAWLYQITPFAISSDTAFFDQIFNSEPLFDQPFVLDGGTFDYQNAKDADAKSVKQICGGLNIPAVTFQFIAPIVQKALQLEEGKLARNFDVVSSLYRLVSIPKIFGLSPEDGLILMSIITDDMGYLAAKPLFGDDAYDSANFLHIIMKMEALSRWLNKTKLTAANLALLLDKTRLAVVPTENMVIFFKGIAEGLADNVCLTPEDFQRQELAAKPWWSLLQQEKIIDENGLVLDIYPVWGQTDEDIIRHKLAAASDSISDNVMNILVQILLAAKNAQDNLLSQAIAAEYGVNKNSVPLQLQWLGSSVCSVLQMILKNTPENVQSIIPELTELTYSLLIYTQLINALKLNKEFIFLRLAQPAWLGLTQIKLSTSLSMDEIYLISAYQDWVANANQNEDKIHEYLAYANNDEIDSSEDDINKKCAELLSEILDWDADEILKAAALADLKPQQAKNVFEVDWIRRLQQLANKTNVSVDYLWNIGLLTVNSEFSLTERVGEAIMAALKVQGNNNG
ncbi:MAG: toxin [Enterobacteriaceae bacterium]|jgi:hypothetical protein|nr:toxin [Enterobacteriaceae bacterium]